MMATSPQAYGGESLPPVYRGNVAVIYRNAKHLSALIDDVLDLSQVEAGRMGLAKEPASLQDIVGEALRVVAPLFEKKGLRLQANLPADLRSSSSTEREFARSCSTFSRMRRGSPSMAALR